jgi:flagellar hook-associated protein 1 FlgK
MSTLSIGISGLNAANIGLSTASHNIANASTPGYNRQVIVQGTNIPIHTGAGYIGQGTNVESVKRIYDQFLSTQVLNAQAGASEMDSYLAEIQQIDNLLADSETGLSPALTEFFNGVQEVAAHPSSIPARQAMLSGAQSLAARFQSLDQRLTEIRQGVNSQIAGEVNLINSYATQIADINEQILLARAGNQLQEPNDLLDQRDQMIADLNQSVRVTTLTQSDGSVNVFFGNGQPLVVGQQAYTLAARPAAGDPSKTVVTMQAAPNTWIELPESQIVGGRLGGLVAFRSDSLDSAQNSLGRIAVALALDVNEQHRMGVDLDGQLGGDFFKIGEPAVIANRYNSAGNGSIQVTFASDATAKLTDAEYQLSYDGSQYTLLNLSTGTGATLPGLPATVDGLTIDLGTWTPTAGDSFVIRPTRGAASTLSVALTDARDIAAAAPIRTSAALANTGAGAISAGEVLDATDANLLATTTINFVAGGYQVNGAGPVLAYTSGAAIDLNGWRVTISGTPAAGDVFTIESNVGGVADNRNANLLASLQTARNMLDGTASYQSAYSQIVSAVGTKTREVKVIGQSQQGLADAAESERQKMSGVNLDEEAGNLIRYQQAYQAAAKVIDISKQLFDDLLAVMN